LLSEQLHPSIYLLMRQVNMHEAKPSRLGLLRGYCQVPDDFDQLGAAEIADLLEGR
jgi:hypothetical protein